MDYRQYTFPTLKDGIVTVEKTMNILNLRYRRGYSLSDEESDYLDWAEKIVHSYYNNGNHRLKVA